MLEAPRWRLTAPHYLNVPTLPDGTRVEWEHRETNRDNGRAVRKLFSVPMLLDPRDPGDFNHPGEIVVTHDVEGAHGVRGDLIFIGDPTPDMEPMNEAAEALTNAQRPRWEHPIDTLPANGGMTSHETAFMQNMMAEFTKAIGGTGLPNASVPKEQYDELKARLEKLEAAIVASAPPTAPTPARRV